MRRASVGPFARSPRDFRAGEGHRYRAGRIDKGTPRNAATPKATTAAPPADARPVRRAYPDHSKSIRRIRASFCFPSDTSARAAIEPGDRSLRPGNARRTRYGARPDRIPHRRWHPRRLWAPANSGAPARRRGFVLQTVSALAGFLESRAAIQVRKTKVRADALRQRPCAGRRPPAFHSPRRRRDANGLAPDPLDDAAEAGFRPRL